MLSEGMAERRTKRGSLEVHLEYAFDRLREAKLAQAYDLLVPGRERVVGARVRESGHEDSGDLRAGVVRAATRVNGDVNPPDSGD